MMLHGQNIVPGLIENFQEAIEQYDLAQTYSDTYNPQIGSKIGYCFNQMYEFDLAIDVT